jgi:hypothetical protein
MANKKAKKIPGAVGLGPLACIQPKVSLASCKDRKIEGQGLRGRRLGPGLYRFVRQDGNPMDSMLATFVEFMDPWRTEMTRRAVLVCKEHGFVCLEKLHDEDSPPKCHHVLVETPRWMAHVSRRDFWSIDVAIMCLPRAKTLAEAVARRGKLASRDAGFFVQVLSRD